MTDEPDTLDDRLRAEEPPVSSEDTSPSQAIRPEERLRAEEPAIVPEDTHPSLAVHPFLTDDWPPSDDGGSAPLQRIVAVAMLLGAVLLTAAAAYVWMLDEEGGSAGERVAQEVSHTTASAGAASTPTATATRPPTQASPQAEAAFATTPTPLPFSTAAADEIAAALLTPAPVQPLSGAIERASAPFTIRPSSVRSQVTQYTVQQGDTLESIASKFGLSDIYTIVWSNKRDKFSPLRPGVQLNIMPEDGVYYEVTDTVSIADLAQKYAVDPYDVIDSEYNNLFGSTPDTLLVKGMWVVVPGGQGERVNLLPPNPNTTAVGGTDVIAGTYNLWGCTANVGSGTLPYTRPLDDYTWMQGFSLGGHEGVDLAARPGTPVHAAGGGTVVFAGWSSYGYGNVVVIAHGPVFTIYGHLSSYAVSCGQSVSAGNVIGAVGSTGNSSGPHLHFEMRDANWNPVNPQNYVGF
jgi:murein DD-endopeptidase MepM/ murein hydrolase activator NlpD